MAGAPHDDPYYPAYVANGWIEEEEEEPMEVEDEEEEPMEEEDEEPEEEEESGPESGDESSDEEVNEGEIVDGPHPTRNHELPLPRPAVQDQEPPPRWAAQLHRWSRELGLRPPFGMCREYFDLSEGTSADRALPVLVGQMTHTDAHTRAVERQLIEIEAEERITAVRVRRIDEQQDLHHDFLETLRRDNATIAARLLSCEERMAAMEQRVAAAEARAAAAEARADAAEAQVPQPSEGLPPLHAPLQDQPTP